MTVIAWDGKTLAADRRIVVGDSIHTTTKIFRIDGCLIGGAGASTVIAETIQWFRDGKPDGCFPAGFDEDAPAALMMVITEKGEVLIYENSPTPIEIHGPIGDENATQMAIGSGKDFALAAMLMGASAVEAVRVASDFSPWCGNGVDSLTFDWS